MAIDWSLLPFGKGKTQTLVRHEKKAAKQTALEKAYAEVDTRDGRRCQVRGTVLVARHADEWKALERNHLGPRSTHPEERGNADNILTCSRAVHRLLQSGALIPVDRHGDETISVRQIAGYVWNRRQVRVGKEPFRLPAGKEWKDAHGRSRQQGRGRGPVRAAAGRARGVG